MTRRELRVEQWKNIKDLLPEKKVDPGRTVRDHRNFFDAILWVARTRAHWRELPSSFERWNSVFQRYNRGRRPACGNGCFKNLPMILTLSTG